jgi:hypothetical protein
MPVSSYVDFRLQEWRMDEQSPRLQASVRRVLNELDAEALLRLKDPKLEVEVVAAEENHSIWAYFPVRRLTASKEQPLAKIRETIAGLPLPLSERNRERAMRLFGQLIVQVLQPKPRTRVLLVFSTACAESEPRRAFEQQLRDHLGHVLLYLREPKANNDCTAAMKEWRMSVRAPAKKAAAKKAKRNRRR